MTQDTPGIIVRSPDHVGLHGADHGPRGQKHLCFLLGHKGFICPAPPRHTHSCLRGGSEVRGKGLSEDTFKCFHLPGSFFPMFPQNLSSRALRTSPKKLGGGPQVATWLPGHAKAANSPYLCEQWRQLSL